MLPTICREAALRFDGTPALVGPDGRAVSYRDLHRLSDEVAAGLLREGVAPGDVVGLRLPSSIEYVIAYVAAAKVGAVTAGVNPRLTAHEQERLLDVAGASLVIADVEHVHAFAVANASAPMLPVDPGRPVAIVFTSGSTGAPKAAVFCDRQLEAIAQVDVGAQWGGGGRQVAATSLAHVGFMTKLPWYLMLGSTTYLTARWRAADVLRLITEERITNLGGVPTQMALLLGLPDLDAHDVSSVQVIVLGGGPASLPLLREARERFGAPISARYSSTETGGCGTGTAFDDPLDEDPGVGFPRGPIRVTVLDDDDRPVPTGEVGHVCVHTPTAFTGYHGDAVATAAAFTADGSVRTGDLGRVDEVGRLHLAGRSKEMYVRGGYNVYPAEVEAVLSLNPLVASVAVVATPDEVMGERAVAVVVPRFPDRPPSLENLRDEARDRLSTYKLPDEVRVVEALPLTAMDKVDRRALERDL